MIIQADSRHIPLVDRCVQCVVTSPPYWGLRDYGTARWDGGDPACDHSPLTSSRHRHYRPSSGLTGGKTTVDAGTVQRDCRKCGARRIDRQLGLESSPDAYVASMVNVFREVWRVLSDDGVLFLNLGDSYATGGVKQTGRRDELPEYLNRRAEQFGTGRVKATATPTTRTDVRYDFGLKPKDLVGIPWRVAFALQADGWYLRSDIIWSKPNPMPESVTDRPTKSHEYVFMLSKAERYFWDAEAVQERSTYGGQQLGIVRGQKRRAIAMGVQPSGNERLGADATIPTGRNVRSVWSIATQSYSGAHFATMPEKLAERCILAGSRPGDFVFDPFGGSGTVGRVAVKLNRRAVLCELNPKYHELAEDRTSEVQISLLEAMW